SYIVTAIRVALLAEYEGLFSKLGIKVGLIMPRCLAESLWLRLGPGSGMAVSGTVSAAGHDKLLLSTSSAGISIIISNAHGNPLFVRSIRCLADEMPDELFRALMYYRDRIVGTVVGSGPGKKTISSFLLTGIELSEQTVVDIIQEVLEAEPDSELKSLSANDLGLDLPSESNLNFPLLAAPAGLAAINHM
ncbi:MAG: hypothetical protein ACRD63_13170, partial [Pyrinomonadaceae bacterium]